MKHFRITGREADGRGESTVFKVEVNFSDEHSFPSFGHNWSKINGEFAVGDNVTRREPLSPNDYEGFFLETGKWVRYWVLFEENPGFATDTVSVWIADEDREPHLAIDRLQLELPWNVERQDGVLGVEMRISPKAIRTSGPTHYLYWRNLIVLKNPGSIGPLLVKPR